MILITYDFHCQLRHGLGEVDGLRKVYGKCLFIHVGVLEVLQNTAKHILDPVAAIEGLTLEKEVLHILNNHFLGKHSNYEGLLADGLLIDLLIFQKSRKTV